MEPLRQFWHTLGTAMHKLLPVLALSLGLCATPPGADPLEPINLLERAQWRAIGAVNFAGFRTLVQCSGTLIAPDLVLTAAHCASDAEGRTGAPNSRHFIAGLFLDEFVADSRSIDIRVHPAYAIARDEAKFRYDIAVIQLANPMPPELVVPLPIATGITTLPGPFGIVAYNRFRPFVLAGRFDCERSNRQDALDLRMSCTVVSGNSGAPVLARIDDTLKVVAVTVASIREIDSRQALAVPIVDWVLEEQRRAVTRARERAASDAANQ